MAKTFGQAAAQVRAQQEKSEFVKESAGSFPSLAASIRASNELSPEDKLELVSQLLLSVSRNCKVKFVSDRLFDMSKWIDQALYKDIGHF